MSAVAQGFVSREALRPAEVRQTEDRRPLGDIALEMGLLSPEQCDAVRGEVRRQLVEDVAWLPEAMRESELGRLAVYRGLLTEDELKTALWTQALLTAEGIDDLLGELMVRCGYLTRHQLIHTLLYEVLFCERCETIFKVNGYERGMRIKCTTCPVMLKRPPEDLRVLASARDLFIDSRAAEERALYGKHAVRHGLCEQQHIMDATNTWARGGGDKQLGQILIELGHIDEEQDKQIWLHVEQERHEKLLRRKAEIGGGKFGEVAVKLGLISTQMLLEILKGEGMPPIGERMVEAGYITRNQGLRVLDTQGKAIFGCGPCGRQYNAAPNGAAHPCPDCRKPMARLDVVETLRVEGALAPAPAES